MGDLVTDVFTKCKKIRHQRGCFSGWYKSKMSDFIQGLSSCVTLASRAGEPPPALDSFSTSELEYHVELNPLEIVLFLAGFMVHIYVVVKIRGRH